MNDQTPPMTPRNEEQTIADLPTQQGIDTVASNLSDSDGSANTELRGSGEERYGIGSELARGGMGAVLNAKDLNLRRDVAMKIVLKPEGADGGQILRFVHEAQVTGQLEHPSIVPVYELGVDSVGKVYYTMKYIRGTNLGDILKGIRHGDAELRSAYPLTRLLNIFIKTCDALAFAHSRGVIHRDLKPDNIMVGDFGEVLVVDWGLAKVLGENTSPTKAASDSTHEPAQDSFVESIRDGDSGSAMNTMDGAIMGTPAYMAPEQAGGNIERIGPPADIYAMGAILYTILTLEAPFSGENVNAILSKVLAGDFIAPAQHTDELPHCPAGKVPSPLSAVVMKAMAMEPEDRYDKVQALQTDAQAYLDGFATSAESAGLWRLTKLFIARHKAMVISILLANIILIGTVATAFSLNMKARRTAVAEGAAAEDALAVLSNEQARGLKARHAAAPALINAAHSMIEHGDLESAWLQAELARDYDPELAAAHMLMAQLLIVDGNHTGALENLAEYQALAPQDALAQRLVHLCRAAASQHEDLTRAAIITVFSDQEVWELADQLIQQQDAALKAYDQRILTAWPEGRMDPSWGGRLPDGSLKVAHLPLDCSDLSPLEGMPISFLKLTRLEKLSDLSPLEGMPLRHLVFTRTKVSDLSPLAGAPLQTLDASNAPLTDLSPIAEAPLKKLIISESKVVDLSPLAGMPLKTLVMGGCNQVADLSPLSSLPLEELYLTGCASVSDLSPLAGMPLRRLDLRAARKVTNLSPLAKCTALVWLDLHNTEPESIEPLRGLPLRSLELWGPSITSLAALKGMPLESLKMHNCQNVDDLSPLAGMPLNGFSITGAQNLTDLTPLAGLSLKSLDIFQCPKIEDISVVHTLSTLEGLILPKRFEPIEFLDELPRLRLVGHDILKRENVFDYRKRQEKRKKAGKTEP